MAPTNAASRSTERTSKGSTQLRKMAAPTHLGRTGASWLHSGPPVGIDEQGGEAEADSASDEHAGPARAVQVGARADRCPREHDGEEEQHDDSPDVDQHLHPGDQFGREHEIKAGQGTEGDDQPEAGPYDVARGDNGRRGSHRDGPEGDHEHIGRCHRRPSRASLRTGQTSTVMGDILPPNAGSTQNRKRGFFPHPRPG